MSERKFDPVAAGQRLVNEKASTRVRSVFNREPVRGWVLALAEQKAAGEELTWRDILKVLHQGAEQEGLTWFSSSVVVSSLTNYMLTNHPELHARTKKHHD